MARPKATQIISTPLPTFRTPAFLAAFLFQQFPDAPKRRSRLPMKPTKCSRRELDAQIYERDHAARQLQTLVALAQKHGTDDRGPEAA
jgi:hypothetical protein